MRDSSLEQGSVPEQEFLGVAGELLSVRPFASVSMADVAEAARVSMSELESRFPDMTSIGDAVLDRERFSMRQVMDQLRAEPLTSSQKLIRAFEGVGANLRFDPVVRAGVRIAAESRDYFPHRRLDPFATWQAFVVDLLESATTAGELRISAELDEAARVLVAAGMGTKDLIAFHGTWETAPAQMASTARIIVGYMSRIELSTGEDRP